MSRLVKQAVIDHQSGCALQSRGWDSTDLGQRCPSYHTNDVLHVLLRRAARRILSHCRNRYSAGTCRKKVWALHDVSPAQHTPWQRCATCTRRCSSLALFCIPEVSVQCLEAFYFCKSRMTVPNACCSRRSVSPWSGAAAFSRRGAQWPFGDNTTKRYGG